MCLSSQFCKHSCAFGPRPRIAIRVAKVHHYRKKVKQYLAMFWKIQFLHQEVLETSYLDGVRFLEGGFSSDVPMVGVVGRYFGVGIFIRY